MKVGDTVSYRAGYKYFTNSNGAVTLSESSAQSQDYVMVIADQATALVSLTMAAAALTTFSF